MPQSGIPLAPAVLRDGLTFLRGDALLRPLLDACPTPTGRKRQVFHALIVAICNQQISRAAASTVETRIAQKTGGRPFTPSAVLSCGVQGLRLAGMSSAKAKAAVAAATAGAEGMFSLGRLQKLSDKQITKDICSIPGAGKWTADMVLIFGLGRPDVMPVGDGGIRRAAFRLLSSAIQEDSAAALEDYAVRWTPHRTLAAWYLWRSLELR